MLPDVEGEEGAEAMGHGVVGVGVLGNGQLAFCVSLEPDPAGTEEGNAFCFKLSFVGVNTSPLLDNLGQKRRFFRFFAALRMTRRKLSKVQVMVQNLTGIVEDCTRTLLYNLLQGHRFKLCPRNQFIEVVNVCLQVLRVSSLITGARDLYGKSINLNITLLEDYLLPGASPCL